MLKHCGTVEIRTQRLLLRPFRMDDAPAMFANYCTDEEVTRYLMWWPHKDIQETIALLDDWIEQYDDPSKYNWAIEYDGQVVGGIGAAISSDVHHSAEVGYCLARRLWGQGMMTEALLAVIDLLFSRVGYNRIDAKHDVLNPASGKVMLKAGMKREGCLRQLLLRKDGSFGDHDIYSILQQEYEGAGSYGR